MPCFTRYDMPVEVKIAFTADNKTLLIDGLFAAGFTVESLTSTDQLVANKGGRRVVIDFTTQTMTVVDGNQSLANEIKRAYSGEVVKQAASRFGWNLKPTEESGVMIAKRRF